LRKKNFQTDLHESFRDGRLWAKIKPIWILVKQEMMGWQWHQLDHIQITSISLQTDNHAADATTSSLNFFTGRMLFVTPNEQC